MGGARCKGSRPADDGASGLEVAQDLVREKEARGTWEDPNETKRVMVAEAVTAFVQAQTAKSTGKARSTTSKIRSTLVGVNPAWSMKTQRPVSDGLLDFCRHKGVTLLVQLTVPMLTDYTASWTCGASHRSKRIQLLRRFFRYCMAADWLDKNPALSLEHPKGRAANGGPKQPFDAQQLPQEGPEWKAILGQVRDHPQLLALTLLMRRAGLRISDATTFHRDRIMEDGSIFLYMSKTNEPVSVPVHPELKAALDAITMKLPDACAKFSRLLFGRNLIDSLPLHALEGSKCRGSLHPH